MSDYSILVVDDSEADRYILKRAFGKINIIDRVFEAENGQDALDFLKSYEAQEIELGKKILPLVVFLDINMPRLSGFEFLEEFVKLKKSKKEYESCVFIMFSSSDNDEDKSKAMSYDFVKDFIIKGNYTPEILKKKLDSLW